MSNAEGPGDELSDDTLAFEYVSGTLRGAERTAFIERLAHDRALESLVQVWEEQLMQLQTEIEPIAPRGETWDGIAHRLQFPEAPSQAVYSDKSSPWDWIATRLAWAVSGAAASMLVAIFFLGQPDTAPESVSSVDYVAVLSTPEGLPALTTLGSATTQNLELHWRARLSEEDQDYQLWAVSRRDGETRSIAIIDDSGSKRLELSHANWRLITDAQSLLLTVEEEGGSAIDEPSEFIVARGLCVRINHDEAKS